VKILLVRSGFLTKVFEEFAEPEGIKIVYANTYKRARGVLVRGVVQGLVSDIQVPEKAFNAGYGHVTRGISPWGALLALEARKLSIPVILTVNSLNDEDIRHFVEMMFVLLPQPKPEIVSLYGGGNQRTHASIYTTLRMQMKEVVGAVHGNESLM
jgi:hypothetical protein